MPATIAPATADARPDRVPNRFLHARDWADPRYARLRGEFDRLYRDEMGGRPHPYGARAPGSIVTHWSREWEYPWAVLNARCQPGMSCVDLGCGGSPLLPYLARLGCACWGVDLNFASEGQHTLRGFIADPGTLWPAITWVRRSMSDTGLPGASMDRVFCISVLEHVTPQEADATFAEVARLLRPRGLALVTTDVGGAHRRMTIPYDELIEQAQRHGLALLGDADFTRPGDDEIPGEYHVVGFVLGRAGPPA